MTHRLVWALVIVSVLPGIATCAVLVLDPGADDEEPLVIYWEPLHHVADTRALFDVAMRSARVHSLVLEVVLERHRPTLLVVGPQADERESRLVVEATRYVLQTLAFEVGTRLMTLDSVSSILDALRSARPQQAPERRALRRFVAEHVDGLPSRPNRRMVLAASAAIAAQWTLDRDAKNL
jgi:hypothetical protein